MQKRRSRKNELPNVSFIKQSLEEFIQSNETYEMVFFSSKSSIGTSYSIRKLMKSQKMVRDNQSSGINR